jgi:hypothetical protein
MVVTAVKKFSFVVETPVVLLGKVQAKIIK